MDRFYCCLGTTFGLSAHRVFKLRYITVIFPIKGMSCKRLRLDARIRGIRAFFPNCGVFKEIIKKY